MKLSQFIALAGASAALTFAASSIAAGGVGSDDGVLFTAVFSAKQVAHKLYEPGDKTAPHPFYKKRCMNAKSTDYTHAMGFGTFWYSPKTKTLLYTFTYNELSGSPIMMHFHLGRKGVQGPIVRTICGSPPPSSKALGYSGKPISAKMCPRGRSGVIWGSYKLAGNNKLTPPLTVPAEEKALMKGRLYVNIHTCLNEAGELRGQIVPTVRKSY